MLIDRLDCVNGFGLKEVLMPKSDAKLSQWEYTIYIP